jgi:Skp family chaperone for outer membrane proteins
MKYLVKFIVVTFFLLICTYSQAEQKAVYIDMKYVLNNCKAGKAAQDYLEKTFKDNQKKFASNEKKLKEQESNLLAKKNDLSKEDYKEEADSLRKKVVEYQASRRSALEKIAKQRTDARNKLLSGLTPILEAYTEENGISIVMDKKYLVMGDTDLDITKLIIEKLNKTLPSIKLN